MYQTQIPRYILRFESLLYVPAFTQKDFHYVHTGPSTKRPPLRNYKSTSGVHNSTFNTQIYTQEMGTKPITKQRKIYLVISNDHKQFSHKTKILKIGLEMIAQV